MKHVAIKDLLWETCHFKA